MIALLLAAVPFADAFWARDLGALQRELMEDAAHGEESLLFGDLLRLATCAPLDPIAQPSPLRSLVRVEEARRGAPETLWRQVLNKDFFNRKPWNPDQTKALRWPDEAERWPAETLLVAEPPWKCAGAAPGPGALQHLTANLIASLPAEAAARAAYERSVLRWREGALEGADRIQVALLPPELQPPARFLRLETKLDPPQDWAALAADWPKDRDGTAVTMRAAQELLRSRRHAALVDSTEAAAKLSPPNEPARAAMVRHILLLRGLALSALGRDGEMIEAFARGFAIAGPEQGLEPLRALGIAALAKRPLDLDLLGRVSKPVQPALEQLTRRALAAGNLATARSAAQRLSDEADPRWRAQGYALAGEIAWQAGDPEGAQAAFARLFTADRKLVRVRDGAALQLAHLLVLAQAGRPAKAPSRDLEGQLDQLRRAVHLKTVPQVDRLLTALRDSPPAEGEQPVALGAVDVSLTPEPPPAPKISIDLPEPRSLLAIPAPDGSLRDWFDTRGNP